MSARGATPVRGRLHFCGTCGATVVFAEEFRPGCLVQAQADRVTLAVDAHFTLWPECRKGNTFQGREIEVCRCGRPMLIPREEGLFCARCDGLISPEVAGPPRRRAARGGAR